MFFKHLIVFSALRHENDQYIIAYKVDQKIVLNVFGKLIKYRFKMSLVFIEEGWVTEVCLLHLRE